MIKKRILFDATGANIAIPSGGAFCTKAYLEVILALFPNQVDVLHPAGSHIQDTRYNTIEIPSRNRYQYVADLLNGYFAGGRFITKHLQENPDLYQLVFINRGHMAGGLSQILQRIPAKTIVLHHNFESEYQTAARSIFTLHGKTGFYYQYWERKGYNIADINLFLTQYDKNLFEKTYGIHTNNYVTGIFEPTIEKQELLIKEKSKSAVITCTLDNEQNVIPIMNFIQFYLPIFHHLLPDWQLHIMGRNPKQKIIDITKNKSYITLTPNPNDIRTLAAQSLIYLCPMDCGGGIKLRIMDGLRAGQPVLLHEQSARGYEIMPDEPFFVTYNNPSSFETGLKKIINYIQSPHFSSEHIQKRYYNRYGLPIGTERLKSILQELNL